MIIGNFIGIGSNVMQGYSAEYQAVLDRATALGYTQPSAAQKTKQNTLIQDLKDAGIWTKLDLFYVFATDGDSDFASLNWKTPASFNLTKVATPTFTSNQGFTGNGTASYLNTGWDPGTNGVNFLQDNAGFGGYINTNTTVGTDWGSNAASFNNAAWFASRNASDQLTTRLNDASTLTKTGVTSSVGFWHIKRTSSVDRAVFQNGISVQTTAVGTSQARSTVDFYIMANNNNGTASSFSTKQYGCFWAGAALTGLEDDFYTAWNTYFISL